MPDPRRHAPLTRCAQDGCPYLTRTIHCPLHLPKETR